MELSVFLAVLLAAACHAGWNALLKLDLESLVATTLLAIASGLVSLPIVMALGLPRVEAWPYLAGSVAVHTAYYLALAQAYRTGDFGQAYPIARGSAPLMTALLSGVVLGEVLPPLAWAGVVMLGGGIVLMAARGGRAVGNIDVRAISFALLTALTITCYTIVDGTGARVSGAPILYTAWLFVLSALVMLSIGIVLRGAQLVPAVRRSGLLAVCGAILPVAAYAIAIWARADRARGGPARDQRIVRSADQPIFARRGFATGSNDCGWRDPFRYAALAIGISMRSGDRVDA